MNLLKIELKKIIPYKTFWACIILYAIFFVFLFTSVGSFKFNINQNERTQELAMGLVYNFPNLWHNITYFAGWFNILLYLLVILLVTNEFVYKTLRQNIIDGMSKSEIIFAKLSLIFLLTSSVTIFVGLVGLISGYSFTKPENTEVVFEKISYLLGFFVQTFGYMTFAMFIGIIFKRPAFGIIFFLLYSIVIEAIISLKLPANISTYLPLETFSNIVKSPFNELIKAEVPPVPEMKYIIGSIIYIVIISALSIFILEKTDN